MIHPVITNSHLLRVQQQLSAPFRQGLTARGLTWAVGIPGRQKVYPANVKLIFPVFFLIFPSVILVTLGPAVIMVSKQMKTYMAL